MSEVIATIDAAKSKLPPEFKKRFIKIQTVKEASRIAIYGIDTKNKKTRIGYKKLIEAYGHDPKKRPEPQQAAWETSGGAHEVTVIGSYGAISGGEEYMRIKGSKTGVPRSELDWNGQVSPPENTESLTQRLDAMERRIAALEKDKHRLEKHNHKLEQANAELSARNEELTRRLAEYEPSDPAGDAQIEEIPTDLTPSLGIRQGWDQMTGWVGRRFSPGEAEPELIVKTSADQPRVIIEEETVYGYSPAERRRGAAIVVGALAIGVAVLGAGLWGEHEESEGAQSQLPKIQMLEHDNQELRAELKGDNQQIGQQEHLLQRDKQVIENLRHRIHKFHQEEKPEAPKLLSGAEFYVEPGNGITQEIQDFAGANGYRPVSAGQAWMLYENMRAEFGDNLVLTANGGQDTYIRPEGDVGIAQPGTARWPQAVEDFLTNRLSR